MICEVNYNSITGKHKVRSAFRSYMRDVNKDFTVFLERLLNHKIPETTRFKVTSADDASDAQKAVGMLYEDIHSIAEEYAYIHPELRSKVVEFLALVDTRFFVDADETQSAPTESNIEHKTWEDVYDAHRNNLDDHCKDVYGASSENLIQSVKNKFQDLLYNAAYINSQTGELVVHSNTVLNENIEQVKQQLLTTLKTFLDQQGIKYANRSWEICRTFYAYFKSLENTENILTHEQSEQLLGKDDAKKSDMFEALCSQLEKEDSFTQFLDKQLKRKKNRPSKCLFLRNAYSPYYQLVKQYVLESKPEFAETIEAIENPTPNLLAATNAYSILTQFDNFLVDAVGKQIKIQRGTHGVESPNKYSYSHDTSHEHKGWQTSEDVGSDRHTSKLTKLALTQIPVYSHKTDESRNRRLDTTSFIVAARHLLDDILYGNIKFDGRELYVEKGGKLIQHAVMTFHADPQDKLRQILELLFNTINGNAKPLYTAIANKRLLTDYDLDILYSTYLKAFDTTNPNSIISQEINKLVNNLLTANLLQEISAYADSNVTMDYLETSIDWETGLTQLRIKKKFFNNEKLYLARQRINRELNAKAYATRKELLEGVNIETGNGTCSVAIDGVPFVLYIPNTSDAGILDISKVNATFSPDTKTIFKNLSNIDLVKFREYVLGQHIPDKEATKQKYDQLYGILKFVDSYLNLGLLNDVGLQTLHVYQALYKPIGSFNNYLMPLVQLAMRAAYVTNQYVKAEEQDLSLVQFLKQSNDRSYQHFLNYPNSKLFVPAYGQVKYVVASRKDEVLDQWIDALSMFNGEASKATTKDGSGNSIPNNSVGKLGGNLHHYLYKQQHADNSSCRSLMFVNDPSLVRATFHDLEAKNRHRDSKNIKGFSCSELFFHSIFNKFWANYANHGTVIIQPTVYSDKTTFLNWEVMTNLLESGDYVRESEKTYMNTIGRFYKQIYQKTQDKFNKLTQYYNLIHNEAITSTELLKRHSELDLVALLNDYNKHIDDLIKQAPSESEVESLQEQKIESLEKHKDYRVVKKNGVEFCVPNELIEFNMKLFNNEALLQTYLTQEKYNFLQNLIDYNASFQVLDFNDKLEYYTSDNISEKATSKNSVIATILKLFTDSQERQSFFKNWVDEKTGKLILAKQNERNILGILGDFNKNEPGLELNPFLDKFFYVEGVLSNNLRLSLTGSEINHPHKSPDIMFDLAKSASDIVDFNKKTKLNLTPEVYEEISIILDQCDSISDLGAYTQHPVIQTIYNESILKTINAIQGAQFKRNVIIPATLQYCQQGTKDGITDKIKCAVIYDERASVFNYRGQSKSVDSADGSAKINPFQSILENKSLGSQAVGFIKKPIWHSYDSENGTAFLAKFATNTMTNEEMRASMQSETSIFRLFKQMTNLQWDEPIDLTKPLLREANEVSHAVWVQNILFGGNKLFYKNKFGEVNEIINFNKSNITFTDPITGLEKTEIVYYTEEILASGEQVKMYHLFDEHSNHISTTSQKEARNLLAKGNHTINSLFELHTSLGGIYCVDSKGNYSEFSNEVVVNFMNNIGYRRPGISAAEGKIVNQRTYYQPLKKYHIGYALNNTAVKNGAKNMNHADAWRGHTKLSYFEVDSDGLGMQMNADHDIINSELTEFSQVIAATAAYGYTYEQCNQIFKGLAKTALEASKYTIEAVEKFVQNSENPQAKSDLYDAIGRLILVEGSVKDKESLKKIILQIVSESFYKNRDHSNDSTKIPFSDPNIHGEFANIIASSITKASIKRKHPGSGCVMVPGYNIITYFEIGDKKYSHTEILNKAKIELTKELREVIKTSPTYKPETGMLGTKIASKLSLSELLQDATVIAYLQPEDESQPSLATISDAVLFNNTLLDRYLNKLQAEAPIFTDKSYFQPEDVVRIITPTGDLEQTIVLDSMEKYYAFKNRPDLPGTTYQVDIKTPRNLKPSLVRWRYNPTSSLEELQVVRSEVYDKPWRDDPTQSNKAFTLSLAQDPTRKFEVVKDHEDGYWSIHFKTIPDGDTFESFVPLTEEQKARLFKAAADAIPVGDKLSTWGSLTPGGVSGINRFKSLGFKQVETREVTDREGNPIQIPILEKTGTYMNIFDLPVIKEAFDKKGDLDASHRTRVQQVLDDLHQGFFVDEFGTTQRVIPGSLENTEAELVMSNIYKDTFGVDNESLQEILDQGERFFIDQVQSNISAPINPVYDLALLKDNGKHSLIRFGEVKLDAYCLEDKFENTAVIEKVHQKTNTKKYVIYYMRGNRPLFKIGEYVNLTEDELKDLYVKDNSIKSHSGKEIDQSMYRIHEGMIQKRIDFVKRYSHTKKHTNQQTGVLSYTTHPLYKIISKKELEVLYGNKNDARKQIGDLISGIYEADSFKFIELNPMAFKLEEFRAKKYTIGGYLDRIIQNRNIPESNTAYLQKQLELLDSEDEDAFKVLRDLKQQFYREEAHKKWVSFQDSLKFISSRIPAQTLQSFMTMKCVGWTENTNNMAYVSHFQIYLQGSDYDIDKAYIMGQSYDSNGKYIQWSPLFDYTSAETLAISKQLTIPDNTTLVLDESGVDISEDLQIILDASDDNLEPISYRARVDRLKALVSVLKKIDRAYGKVTFSQTDSPKLASVLKLLNDHFTYVIPEAVAEAAYKNVASANIYEVSHDLRNRDQAYTEIAMDILQKAAKESPKGEQAATLNMLNPLTKYVMQYQNIVGKNVIGVAANGEKVWFNAYYYWTKLLKEGRTDKLQFRTTLKRVAGRAKLKTKELSQLPEFGRTVNILPDLNPKDKVIKNNLLQSFGVDLDKETYAYVDQLISQLLSAATDNAKELILAKINSGMNFARMYVYLIMTGYNFDDIVSFMISPVAEFIDSMSSPNMFQDMELGNTASKAINLSKGIVKSKDFLHGTIETTFINEETSDTETRRQSKIKIVKEALSSNKYYQDAVRIVQTVNNLTEEDELDLDTIMQGYILLSVENPQIDLTSLIKSTDMEINSYILYCQNIAYKLRGVARKYESTSEMLEDSLEFSKIYSLASEISSIASAWLGLNQGLPTDDLSLLKRFSSMRKVITNRELSLGIFDSKIFTESTDAKAIAKADRYFERAVNNIIANNSELTYEEVSAALKQAHQKGLIGTFDIYRYLTDMEYRKDMIEYNHIIKGTLNVLDMMEEIPHYKQIINCLEALAVSRNTLNSKNRLLTHIMQETDLDYLTDQQLRGIIRYADKLNGVNFFRNFKQPIVLKESIEGFNNYFVKVPISSIDLTTFHGMATFKHWIEHEFLEYLRTHHVNNPLVKHLQLVGENQRDILATDIDLLQPNITTSTLIAYDEIIRGMAAFDLISYPGTDWKISDLFQIYNILVNSNQYGGERLTTAFKKCSNPDSIIRRYWEFIAKQDYNHFELQDYELYDYYINAAPLVSTGTERFRTEKFIKVNDPVEGYILKEYDSEMNEYKNYPLIPPKELFESNESRLPRLQNFVEYCPYEMPVMAKVSELFEVFEFEGDVTEDLLHRIKNILLDYSTAGKLLVFKDC